MDIMNLLKEKKPLIDREMEKVLPRKASKEWLAGALGKTGYAYGEKTVSREFNEPVWEFLDRGGKRWRPALLLSSCKAVGGSEKEALPFSPLPELIHNGTIIVDDVEDGAEMRRGKKTMHLLHGVDTAVNNGNALYFAPLLLLYRNPENLEAEKRIKVYDLYAEEMLRVSIGQAMDIHWHKGKSSVNEKAYLQMCVYKTGVLARFSAKLGGILGNGKKREINALGKFGESLGIGFQIQDDILNIAPASEEWGKEIGEDIREGKRTLLVLRALEELELQHSKELLRILDSHTKKRSEIEKAVELIKGTDAIEYARQKSSGIVKKSWKELEKVLRDNEGKRELKAFAEFAVNREI